MQDSQSNPGNKYRVIHHSLIFSFFKHFSLFSFIHQHNNYQLYYVNSKSNSNLSLLVCQCNVKSAKANLYDLCRIAKAPSLLPLQMAMIKLYKFIDSPFVQPNHMSLIIPLFSYLFTVIYPSPSSLPCSRPGTNTSPKAHSYNTHYAIRNTLDGKSRQKFSYMSTLFPTGPYRAARRTQPEGQMISQPWIISKFFTQYTTTNSVVFQIEAQVMFAYQIKNGSTWIITDYHTQISANKKAAFYLEAQLTNHYDSKWTMINYHKQSPATTSDDPHLEARVIRTHPTQTNSGPPWTTISSHTQIPTTLNDPQLKTQVNYDSQTKSSSCDRWNPGRKHGGPLNLFQTIRLSVTNPRCQQLQPNTQTLTQLCRANTPPFFLLEAHPHNKAHPNSLKTYNKKQKLFISQTHAVTPALMYSPKWGQPP